MMITIEMLLEWKQQYEAIFQMTIQEQTFIFHPLGREEYKQIVMMDLELGEFQEAICFNSMIHPEDYDFTKGMAGVAEVLSEVILEASGLQVGQAPQLLMEFREEMRNFDYQADCVIHEAFPEFTLEEISTWSIRKTMYYLSRAEWIMEDLKGVHLQYLDEQVQKQMMDQQQQEQEASPPPIPESPRRQIRKELVEAPEIKEKPKQAPSSEGSIQSEEELLAMLAGAGTKVAAPITDLSKEATPELNWFGYMDELKGEFD